MDVTLYQERKVLPVKLDTGYLPQARYFVQPPYLPQVSEEQQRQRLYNRSNSHRWSAQNYARVGDWSIPLPPF